MLSIVYHEQKMLCRQAWSWCLTIPSVMLFDLVLHSARCVWQATQLVSDMSVNSAHEA